MLALFALTGLRMGGYIAILEKCINSWLLVMNDTVQQKNNSC